MAANAAVQSARNGSVAVETRQGKAGVVAVVVEQSWWVGSGNGVSGLIDERG